MVGHALKKPVFVIAKGYTVEAVREPDAGTGPSAGLVTAFAKMLQKVKNGRGVRGNGVRLGGVKSAMVITAAGEKFFPRLGTGRRDTVFVGEFYDQLRRQIFKNGLGE